MTTGGRDGARRVKMSLLAGIKADKGDIVFRGSSPEGLLEIQVPGEAAATIISSISALLPV
jgi:hypothetical protein